MNTHRRVLRLLVFAVVVTLAAPVLAQQTPTYSAQVIVTSADGKRAVSNLYQGHEKIRIESADPQNPANPMILDLASGKLFVIDAQHKAYMEFQPSSPESMQQWSQITARFDPKDPCTTMRQAVASQGRSLQCQLLGHETLNGRPVVKVKATNQENVTSTYWVDPELRTAVRAENPQGTMELTNIKIGPQPPELFDIPSGYQKLDATIQPLPDK